uniref:Uncharacterized protein n=1 Tax=Oryza glumipatula TaxID=40148 RepID=A0A0E0A8I6_9ORYZ
MYAEPRRLFFVTTRMVQNLVEERRLSPFTVTPDAYARAAVRWIRRGGALCTPSGRHQLLWCVAAALLDASRKAYIDSPLGPAEKPGYTSILTNSQTLGTKTRLRVLRPAGLGWLLGGSRHVR